MSYLTKNDFERLQYDQTKQQMENTQKKLRYEILNFAQETLRVGKKSGGDFTEDDVIKVAEKYMNFIAPPDTSDKTSNPETPVLKLIV